MMESPTKRIRSGQDGMAMALVLVIGAALLVMGAMAQALFNSSSTGATYHVRGEQALHLAEQGVDKTIGELQASNLGYSTDSQGFPAMAASVDTPEEEEAWLLANFGPGANTSGYVSDWLKSAPQGQFVAVRPSTRKTIYAISWIPSRAAPKKVRVLKAEYLPANFSPEHALLTGGDLQMFGNAAVAGIAGSVHSNGNIQVTGASVSVTKTVTTSGTFSPDPPTFQSVGGTEKNSPRQDIAEIDPLDFWMDGHGAATYSGAWYDLCPDGHVRAPLAANTAPCTGTDLGDASKPHDYQGWQYTPASNKWGYNGAGTQNGVFYAHQANIDVSGTPGSASTPWRATLIASASTSGASACGHANGAISITGGPVLTSYGQNNAVTMMAGTDLELRGTPATALSGLFLAHEQVDISGNGTLNGSVLAQDHCHSTGTPVASSQVGGSMSITFNADITASIGKTVRTTLWQELSPVGYGGA